jgi:hypothetical protein
MYVSAILPFLASLEPVVPSNHTMFFEQTCSHLGATFTCEELKRTVRLTLGEDRVWAIEEGGVKTPLRIAREDDHVMILEKKVEGSGTSMIHILLPSLRFYWFEVTWDDNLKSDNVLVLGGRIR